MGERKRDTLEQAEVKCQQLGSTLAAQMPHGWGFMLHLFTVGGPGYSTFVSTARPEYILPMLEEVVARMHVDGDFGDHTDRKCWTCGSKHGLRSITRSVRSVELCTTCAAMMNQAHLTGEDVT